jgi:hypothetical protein
VAPALAQGGFALSGSFYTQAFEMPQGSRLSAPDVYVVVFNHTDGDFRVRMTTETPVGVKLIPSLKDFSLAAGEQQRVEIALEVTAEAAPGTYEIGITAEPYHENTTGIQIIGAASQTAELLVTGEGARVKVQTENPDGEPVPGVVRLYKVVADQRYEVAYSETGTLATIVAPGSYAASAYLAGELLAEENFDVLADEEKEISLVVKTVYFENFGLVPSYRNDTGELTIAEIVYTVKNLLKPVDNAEIILQVSHDGNALDSASLANLSPLDLGRVGLSYNYIPSDGWQNGTYGFQLQLNLDGKPFTNTEEKTLTVGDGSAVPAQASQTPDSGNWQMLALGGILIALVIGLVLVTITRRRKKETHDEELSPVV